MEAILVASAMNKPIRVYPLLSGSEYNHLDSMPNKQLRSLYYISLEISLLAFSKFPLTITGLKINSMVFLFNRGFDDF